MCGMKRSSVDASLCPGSKTRKNCKLKKIKRIFKRKQTLTFMFFKPEPMEDSDLVQYFLIGMT